MATEDLTTWTLQNSESVLSVTSSTLTATGLNAGGSVIDQIYKDRGSGFYSGNFTHRVGPINISGASSENSRLTILGVGLSAIDVSTALAGSMAAVWVNTTTNPTISIVEFSSANTGNVPDNADHISSYQNAAVGIGTNFWLELSRTGTTATLKIYSDAYTTLLQTLTFTLTQALNYEFVYIGKAPAGSGATVSGTIQNVDLAPSTGLAGTASATSAVTGSIGNPSYTPIPLDQGGVDQIFAGSQENDGTGTRGRNIVMFLKNWAVKLNQMLQQLYGVRSYQQPTTEFNITIPVGVTDLILDPAGTLATGTIVFPPSPVDRQPLKVMTSQSITALTVSPNTGQTVLGAPTTLAANGFMSFQYRAANLTWFRAG